MPYETTSTRPSPSGMSLFDFTAMVDMAYFEWVACEKAPVPCSLVYGTNSRNEASRLLPPYYQQPADVRRTWIWGKDGGLVVSTFSALGKNDVKAHSRQLASSPLETKPTQPHILNPPKHTRYFSPHPDSFLPDRWLPQADCRTKTLSDDCFAHRLTCARAERR